MHFKTRNLFHYFTLTKAEKRIYRHLSVSWLSKENSVTISEYDKSSNLSKVVHAILYDIPELFYVSTHKLVCTTQGRTVQVKATFLYSDSEIERLKKHIYQQLSAVKALSRKSTYDKALAAHNFLVENVSYAKNTSASHCHNIIGSFFQRETVCEGYAKAYKLICDELNVPCFVVVNQTHAWNMIKVNGHYFHVDVTGSVNTHKAQEGSLYFMVSDALFLKAHTINHTIYPKCTTPGKVEKDMIFVDDTATFSNIIEKTVKAKTPELLISFKQKFKSTSDISRSISLTLVSKHLCDIKSFRVAYHPSTNCAVIYFQYKQQSFAA